MRNTEHESHPSVPHTSSLPHTDNTGNPTDNPQKSTVSSVTPGDHTTETPAHKTTNQHSTVSTSLEPSTTETSTFDGASFGGGFAAGMAIAILLLCLLYLFYYCRKPNPAYEEC